MNRLSYYMNQFFSRGWIYLLLIFFLYFLIYKQLLSVSIPAYWGICLSPFIIMSFIYLIKYSYYGFYFIFATHFIAITLSDFFTFQIGVITFMISFVFLLFLVIQDAIEKKIKWDNSFNVMFWSYSIWGLLCIAELANPLSKISDWEISTIQYAFYPIICAILVPKIIKSTRDINILLFIWSIFIIIATIIAYRQQHFGFNTNEKYFLYTLGGAKTHLVWSGIRYFSCFTDAANYGVHMAMAATTIGLSIFFIKNRIFKIYLSIITVMALYGFAISGTRSAIAIPFTTLILFTIISKNKITKLLSVASILILFLFFNFTHIGDNNQYVWRIRSAFHPYNDASYSVRVTNRENIKKVMDHTPFGFGIGRSKSIKNLPPDSLLIGIWIETGAWGLSLYLVLHIIMIAWASWLLLYKVQNKRVRGLLISWLGMCTGFLLAAYGNDILQYPNSIIFYTGLALCFAAPQIDSFEKSKKVEEQLYK